MIFTIPSNNVSRATLLLVALYLSACAGVSDTPSSDSQDAELPVSPEVVTEAIVEPPVEEAVDSEVLVPDEPAVEEEPVILVTPVPVPEYDRDDVIWIQQRLQELGYYTGSIDGSAGGATRRAIKAYQFDQGLEADGRPTAELRAFMWRNGG